MKSALASFSESCRKTAQRLAAPAALYAVLMAFAGLVLGEARAQPAKPGPGSPIAPPAGTDAEADRSDADKFWEEVPGDVRAGVTDMSFPLEPGPETGRQGEAEKRRRAMEARSTDTEIMGSQRTIDKRLGSQVGELDRALGVEEIESSREIPSFTLGVQKIKKFYQAKNYEEALIDSNELLRYYPRSAQLLMMKGTLHQKLGQVDLALLAYRRAFEYEPSRKLQQQIEFLKFRISEREALRAPAQGIVTPGDAPEIRNKPAASPPPERK